MSETNLTNLTFELAVYLRNKYQKCIPVVIVSNLNLNKRKYLVPETEPFWFFISEVYRFNPILEDQTYSFIIADQMFTGSTLMKQIDNYCDSDGFVRVYLEKESFFG